MDDVAAQGWGAGAGGEECSVMDATGKSIATETQRHRGGSEWEPRLQLLGRGFLGWLRGESWLQHTANQLAFGVGDDNSAGFGVGGFDLGERDGGLAVCWCGGGAGDGADDVLAAGLAV